ncbi:MAG: SCO5389 family protein [Patescibacteria group bacterium]
MSLTAITPEQTTVLKTGGMVSSDEWFSIIAESLPKAWEIIKRLVTEAEGTKQPAIFSPPNLDDTTRGELLRMMASTSIRESLEILLRMKFGFQNCHKVGVFPPGHEKEYHEFTSIKSQLLNQSQELRDC